MEVAKRARVNHVHNANCQHPQVVKDGSLESCAAAQVLNSLADSLPRFSGKGTLTRPLQQAKITVGQCLVPREMATGEVIGLIGPMSRVLRVEKSFVNFALEKKSDKSNESLNVDLVKGHDVERQRRRDWYDRGVVYNYFHHEGSSPDFCSLVEPDKSKTKSWNAKSFTLGGGGKAPELPAPRAARQQGRPCSRLPKFRDMCRIRVEKSWRAHKQCRYPALHLPMH